MSSSVAARVRTIGVPALGVGAWVAIVLIATRWSHFEALRGYHEALTGWLDGQALYDPTAAGQVFDLSPMAALLLIPVMSWPIPVGVAVITGLSLVAVLLCIRLCFAGAVKALPWSRWPVWGVVTLGVLAIEPVRQSLGLGQISLVILAVILIDLTLISRRHPAGGIGIGLATAMQPMFGLFVIFLVITRRWQASTIAAITLLLSLVLSLFAFPQATGVYLADRLFSPGNLVQLSDLGNQALSGVMARLYETGSAPAITWLGFALFAAAWGLAHARDAHLRGNRLAAVTIVGLTGLVVSPVSWWYQFVWAVPALGILLWWALTPPLPLRRPTLWDRPWGRWVITSAMWLWFLTAPIWWSMSGGWRLITENGYLIATICLIAILPRAAHRCPADRFATPRSIDMV
ncbi:uncharacterized protein DUF2029 [Stackebrandtia endophytica]|uniref:Uncharacterized protein DUF2029 n=1 Tax=Stackebrandtia endophytica TaxID=1496996 RepID=A0A543B3U1_9ACTN|nr:glycosyltransferase family 87 protein [Stackebrandtia endophytica]TQL79494.1 uncharacterized protein DUF2029 [Stackebrandtia endophytica]